MASPEKDKVLDKIKKLEEMIAKKKALLIREKGRLSEKERKARTRKLIQMGGLAEIAGLAEADSGFLLGYLIKAKDIEESTAEWRGLKSKGDAILEEREEARKKASKTK